MRTKLIYPVAYQTYTLQQILIDLALKDSPSLLFYYKDKEGVIQDSHMSDPSAMLAIPNMAGTEWKFIHHTSESIPIFRYEGDINILLTTVDIELKFSPGEPGEEETVSWWVTPKGYPRKQAE